jgi:hypothetical protein
MQENLSVIAEWLQGWWHYVGRVFVLFVAIALVTIIVSEYLFSARLFSRLLNALASILRIARLPIDFSTPLLFGVFDSRAEHSLISSMVKECRVRENEVIVYNLVSMPITAPKLVIQYVAPVIISTLGLTLGITYVCLSLASTLIAFIMGLALSRITIKSASHQQEGKATQIVNSFANRQGGSLRNGIKKALRYVRSVSPRFVVILTTIFVLLKLGCFEYLKSFLMLVKNILPMSPAILTVAATYAVTPIASYQLAGSMLLKGLLTVKEMLVALFLGRIFFGIVSEYPRHSFPFYVSIYPVKLAAKLTATLLLYTIVSSIVMITLITLLYP